MLDRGMSCRAESSQEITDTTGDGAYDWYCERAFIDQSHETGMRDRTEYQKELAKDREKLKVHLTRRDVVIDRAKRRKTAAPRSGRCRI